MGDDASGLWQHAFELCSTPMALLTREGTVDVANRAALTLLGASTRVDEAGERFVVSHQTDLGANERLVELRPRLDEQKDYQVLFDQSPLPLFVYDVETFRYLAVNDAAVRHYGYSRAEFMTMGIMDIRPAADVGPLKKELARLGPGSEPLGVWRHRKRDGTVFEVEIISHSTFIGGRKTRLVVAVDLTERRQLEDRQRQAQKMEAIGRLSGGIAHDFNNLLSVILSGANLALADLPSDHPVRVELEAIEEAGKRAAELTARLLTFSRQNVARPVPVDLGAFLVGMKDFLRRLLGGAAELELRLTPTGPVMADHRQLEQIVLNLVANARDAMPRGGVVTLKVTERVLEAGRGEALAPGRYVELEVSDTGVGMDVATQARAFEAFFTTKEEGRGTGIGLATVQGVVEELGGAVALESTLGVGTTFTISLPLASGAVAATRASEPVVTLEGTESVLVVDDHDAVRRTAVAILRRHGYQVFEAQNAGEALMVAEQHPEISLLVTDVVLPRVGGVELFRRLWTERPGLRTRFVSGQDPSDELRRSLDQRGNAFLAKPFTATELLRKVRQVLLFA